MASNIKGFNDSWSDTTASSFTVVVEIEPDPPSAPLKGGDNKYNVLHAYWSAIPHYSVESGGVSAAILSYHLQRNEGNNTDSGTSTDTWTDLVGLSPASLLVDYQTS
jgi:hypothetical protein